MTTPALYWGGQVHIILWSYVCHSVCLKPTQFQGEISSHFGADFYKNLQKNDIDILMLRIFFPKMSLDACVATFVSIQTNFKVDRDDHF